MAAAARGVDDPLPGNQMKQRRPERAERHPDGPRAARLTEDRRDLAVGDDLAARHATHDAVHEPGERRRRASTAPRFPGTPRRPALTGSPHAFEPRTAPAVEEIHVRSGGDTRPDWRATPSLEGRRVSTGPGATRRSDRCASSATARPPASANGAMLCRARRNGLATRASIA